MSFMKTETEHTTLFIGFSLSVRSDVSPISLTRDKKNPVSGERLTLPQHWEGTSAVSIDNEYTMPSLCSGRDRTGSLFACNHTCCA